MAKEIVDIADECNIVATDLVVAATSKNYTVNALDYDDILEQVFQWMDAQGLLNCRLVNHQWNFLATQKLKKIAKLSFWYADKRNEWCKILTETESSVNFDISMKLQDLTLFLKSNGSESFPVRKFGFQNGCLSDQNLQDFLNTYGTNLQKLSLMLDETTTVPPQSEMNFVKKIQNLICRQVPNIEILKLSHDLNVEWKAGDPSRDYSSVLYTTDQEYEEIQTLVRNSDLKNTKLKFLNYFDYHLGSSAKILETIINIAPKLEDIFLSKRNYNFLTQPNNKIYLLKYICLEEPKRSYIGYDIDILQKAFVAKKILHLIQVRDLNLELLDSGTDVTDFKRRRCIIDMMNHILACSWNSVATIALRNVGACYEISWPYFLLPNVWQITLSYGVESNHGLFPPKLDFTKTFPKLRVVKLYVKEHDLMISDHHFLNKYNFPPMLTVASVLVFILYAMKAEIQDGKRNEEDVVLFGSLPLEMSVSISKFLPNAKITFAHRQ